MWAKTTIGVDRRQTFDVILQPFELLISEIAETARFQIDHVDETDEVDAVLIKAVPTCTFRPLAVALQVGFAAALVDHVVLARHIECCQSGCLDRLIGVVELHVLRQVGNVAGMKHKGRLDPHRLDLGDSLLQSGERIWVHRLVEADVAVADLQEGEGTLRQLGSHGTAQAE